MPFRIVQDSKGEFRLSFTPLGFCVLIVYLVAQIGVGVGIYYQLKQQANDASTKADAAYKLAEEKASREDVKRLTDADTAFESRIKRAEDDLGKQLTEIRQDVKQILRDLPRAR